MKHFASQSSQRLKIPPDSTKHFNYKIVIWKFMSIYSSITNKMQSYTMVFITINALHVSGSSSAHHQEHETVYTASSICRAFSASYRYRE